MNVRAVVLIFAALPAACGGTASAPAAGAAACGTLVAPPPMAYPAAGATGVPDGNFTLILLAQAGTSVQLVGPGNRVTTLAAAPLPLPSPSATPVPGSNFGTYAVGALAPATSYTVQIYFAATAVCGAQTENVGSFTTR